MGRRRAHLAGPSALPHSPNGVGMDIRRLSCAVLIALGSGLFSSCSTQECHGKTDCGPGFICKFTSSTSAGVCNACATKETPYNGEDDDCDPSTRDGDLDGDGDNAKNAAVNPGTDCDDNDRFINPRQREICGNGKDDNCNGAVDEPECADQLPPTIHIDAPSARSIVSGPVTVTITAADDVEVKQVELFERDQHLETKTDPPYVFTYNTAGHSDGEVTLKAVATDLLGKTAMDQVTIIVDTQAPQIIVAKPHDGSSYGGMMKIDFSAQDLGSGVMSVDAKLDGSALSFPAPPYRLTIDTTTLDEGAHTLAIHTVDRGGHETTQSTGFRVDRTPPNVRFATPTHHQIVRGQVNVEVDADDAAGIAEIRSGTASSMMSPLMFTSDFTMVHSRYTSLLAEATDATIVDDGMSPGNRASTTVQVIVDDGTLVPCAVTVALPMTGTVSGTTLGKTDAYHAACSPVGAPDTAYSFTAPVDLDSMSISATSDFPIAIHVYREFCGETSLLACASQLTMPVAVGEVKRGEHIFVIVDGANATASGNYSLIVTGKISPGFACDPQSRELTCARGTCASDGSGFACPGADCSNGIDDDGDGRTDENAAMCVAPPALTCPPTGLITVLEDHTLTAIDSGNVMLRRWSLISAPFGSDIALSPLDATMTHIHPLLAGDYVVRYTVLGANYEFNSCESTLTAATDDDLRVELLWNPDTPEAFDHSDVDLHLLHPDATAWQSPPLDCFYANTHPRWDSDASLDDDPRLDIDDTNGRGPENINIKAIPSAQIGRPYRVGVHYYSDHGFGPSQVYLTIFCNRAVKQTYGPVTLQNDQIWRVADVAFMANKDCAVTTLGTANNLLITNPGDPSYDAR
jgi:Big-like domain-containing protein/putative metal-binding protein